MALPFHLPERERESTFHSRRHGFQHNCAYWRANNNLRARGGSSCSNKQSQSGPGSSIRVAALGRKAGGWPRWPWQRDAGAEGGAKGRYTNLHATARALTRL